MDDGTERLRGQFRDAAQHGQADDYGGDHIEDAAAQGVRRTEKGVEGLLKGKKTSRGRTSDSGQLARSEPPAAPEAPKETPRANTESPHIKTRETGFSPQAKIRETAPSPQADPKRPLVRTRETAVRSVSPNYETTAALGDRAVQPQIKTREAAARNTSLNSATTAASGDGAARPLIKTREAAAHNTSLDSGINAVSGNGAVRPQIKTREAAARSISLDSGTTAVSEDGAVCPLIKTREVVARSAQMDNGIAAEPDSSHPAIKTKETYMQRCSPPSSEPPQMSAQRKREFVQGQGQTAAVKQADTRHSGGQTVPQTENGNSSPRSVPDHRVSEQHRYVRSGQSGTIPSRSANKGTDSSIRTGRETISGRKTVFQTVHSNVKTAERSARTSVKTAEHSTRKAVKTAEIASKKAVKTADRTVKTAEKTAQATEKAAQKAAQAAKAAAKAAVKTVKTAAKVIVAALKAILAAAQALIAFLIAGGWIVVLVVLVIVLIGMLVSSYFGLFCSSEDSGTGYTMTSAVAQINEEFMDRIEQIKTDNPHDTLDMYNSGSAAVISNWNDVLAIYAVRVTTDPVHPDEVATMTEEKLAVLREIFWDMTEISYRLGNWN